MTDTERAAYQQEYIIAQNCISMLAGHAFGPNYTIRNKEAYDTLRRWERERDNITKILIIGE